ncbi:hypothetical protein [Pandoraea sp. CB10b_02]|uniref:hypothetical protein n=1 Tax=Pandoraea sp. CB10b_02 TaxID=2014535 RepID=UPI00257E8A3D|nr:hypothetical protein [Pandoraea sp. CB10b_02]
MHHVALPQFEYVVDGRGHRVEHIAHCNNALANRHLAAVGRPTVLDVRQAPARETAASLTGLGAGLVTAPAPTRVPGGGLIAFGLRTKRVEVPLQHLQRRPELVHQRKPESGDIDRRRAVRRTGGQPHAVRHGAEAVSRTRRFVFAAPRPGAVPQGFEIVESHRVIDASSRFMRFGVLKNRKKPRVWAFGAALRSSKFRSSPAYPALSDLPEAERLKFCLSSADNPYAPSCIFRRTGRPRALLRDPGTQSIDPYV